MALGADRYASRADTLIFLGCIALSLAAMSLPTDWRDPFTKALRQTVLAPLLALQQQSELLRTSRARFTAVVAQRDSAALAATFLSELRSENARLRSRSFSLRSSGRKVAASAAESRWATTAS